MGNSRQRHSFSVTFACGSRSFCAGGEVVYLFILSFSTLEHDVSAHQCCTRCRATLCRSCGITLVLNKPIAVFCCCRNRYLDHGERRAHLSRGDYCNRATNEVPSSLSVRIYDSPTRAVLFFRSTACAVCRVCLRSLYVDAAGGGVWAQTARGTCVSSLRFTLMELLLCSTRTLYHTVRSINFVHGVCFVAPSSLCLGGFFHGSSLVRKGGTISSIRP